MKVVFVLSKSPHLHRAYVVTVCRVLSTAVLLLINIFFKIILPAIIDVDRCSFLTALGLTLPSLFGGTRNTPSVLTVDEAVAVTEELQKFRKKF